MVIFHLFIIDSLITSYVAIYSKILNFKLYYFESINIINIGMWMLLWIYFPNQNQDAWILWLLEFTTIWWWQFPLKTQHWWSTFCFVQNSHSCRILKNNCFVNPKPNKPRSFEKKSPKKIKNITTFLYMVQVGRMFM